MQKTILLLEDEILIGETYEKVLKKAGYRVLWTRTIRETKKIIQENTPIDLALLDQLIKDEKAYGTDLIPLLREKNTSIKIVILSNYDHKELEYTNKGADDHLMKLDIRLGELLKYVDNILHTKK